MKTDNDDSLQSIIQQHMAGDLAQAEYGYREWLSTHSAEHSLYADCLHHLGVITVQRGDSASAREYLQQAVNCRREPLWLANLAAVCCDGGDYPLAETLCEEALLADNGNANLHFILGDIAREKIDFLSAIQHYRKALTPQPLHRQAAVNLATVLQENQQTQEAIAQYKHVLAHFPDDAVAQHNYRMLMNKQLPAWHFPMLADGARNDAFQRAIEKAVTTETTVLDIGTGSGLLAMMAARAGASSVTACELNTAVADIARNVIGDNAFNNITVINKKSTAMTVADDGDMTEKADVLIAEIVDAGLLGEEILPTFRHASQHLLKPGAKIIPHAATIFAQLVEIPRLHCVNPIRHISGFDLSAFDIFRVPHAPQVITLNAEPYRPLTAIFPVCDFNFYQIPNAGHHDLPARPIQATENGTVCAIVYWFTLHLDETISISTAPDGNVFCWQQSIQFFEQPLAVSHGDVLHLHVAHNDKQMRFHLARQNGSDDR